LKALSGIRSKGLGLLSGNADLPVSGLKHPWKTVLVRVHQRYNFAAVAWVTVKTVCPASAASYPHVKLWMGKTFCPSKLTHQQYSIPAGELQTIPAVVSIKSEIFVKIRLTASRA
jgi:hypothetical protein